MDNGDFKGKILPQLIAALAANMGAFAWGTIVSWSASALPKLREDPSFTFLTSGDESWIGSIATLGACVAGLPAGWAVDYFGRKKTMLFLSLPFLGGWLLIYFANNTAMLIAGRFITGFFGGAYSVTAPIFIAETSQPKIRGMLMSGFDLMLCCGILFILVVGKYVSWENQALVCAFVPLICLALMLIVPESPRYLIAKGRQTEGSHSLQWFRGTKNANDIKRELFELTESIEEEVSSRRWRDLWEPSVRKPFTLGFLLFFFQVTTGIIAVNSYSVDIFRSAGSSMDEYDSSALLGAVQIVSSVASALVVDRFGRRILLVASEVFIIISLAGLGAYFNVKESREVWAEDNLSWLPLTCLLIYLSAYTVGLGPIPYSLAPEILPQRARGLASSILSTWKWGLAFLVSRFFANLIEGLGDDGCYWFFAAWCILGLIFIFFFIPETKGRSLEEIQKYFSKNSPRTGLQT